MNNDLEQFSEERLKQMVKFCETSIHGLPKHFEASEVAALARIALAAKQAKPVALVVIDKHTDEVMLDISDEGRDLQAGDALYTTPQPVNTEQGQMPDKALSLSETIGELRKYIDSSGGYNFEALRSEQVNSPVVPDGWKLVPIEPTQEMVDACFEATSAGGIQKGYRAMLAAAPKPESE